MSRIEKILAKMLSKPPPRDLKWRELVKVLGHFGYVQMPSKGSGGSRRRFYNEVTGAVICGIDEPHPKPDVPVYAVKKVIMHLRENGVIDG